MKLVIRNPTGQQIDYTAPVSIIREIINSFCLRVPSTCYDITEKKNDKQIVLQLLSIKTK